MKNNIFPVTDKIETHLLSKELFRTVTRAGIQNGLLNQLSVSCQSDGKEIIIYFNPDAAFSYSIDLGIEDAFFYFINILLVKEKIGFYDAYKLIKIFEKITKEEINIFKLFNYFGWPSGKKGLSIYREFGDFSPILIHFIKEKKCSLSEAYAFHKYFFNNYENILSFFPDDLTYSETNFLLKTLSEFGKGKNIGTEAVLEILAVEHIKNKKEMIDYVYSMRYPFHSKCLKKFQDFIKDFNFPKGIKIAFDKNFERKASSMEIDFTSLKDLQKKIAKINSEIERKISGKEFVDLFEQEKLFDENGK